MSIVLVVDAACDLPLKFINERGIVLFPITANVDGQLYEDEKNVAELNDFYSKNLLTLEHEAETIPFSPERIQQVFVDEIISEYDFAFVQTVSRKRSPIYDNYTVAQPKVLKAYREGKDSGKYDKHFGMRVMNSANMFTGQGLLAAFTSDLIAAGKSKQDILRLAEAFKDKIYAYALPPNVAYIRERARKRGEDSLSALGAFVAKSFDIKPIIRFKSDETAPVAKYRGFENSANKLFDYAAKRVEAGLLSRYVIVSIAGDETELLKFDGFKKLLEVAKENRVEVLTTVMGLSSGINLGPGAISLSLAAENHDFEV
jgi:DegV family protein with EDD domain